jgi:hypothetical protein
VELSVKISDKPFPHTVIDGFWDGELLRAVAAEFPDPSAGGWIRYSDENHEVKLEGDARLWGPRTRELVEQIDNKGPELAELFGMPELILRTEGGGYHQIEPGGKLAVHADFNRSEDGLYRRLNVIIYLNPGWTEADGGHLELLGEGGSVTRVLPQFNRTLVFETSDKSFHGHPAPLPGPRRRQSFAAYFFSVERPERYLADHTTVWHS